MRPHRATAAAAAVLHALNDVIAPCQSAQLDVRGVERIVQQHRAQRRGQGGGGDARTGGGPEAQREGARPARRGVPAAARGAGER